MQAERVRARSKESRRGRILAVRLNREVAPPPWKDPFASSIVRSLSPATRIKSGKGALAVRGNARARSYRLFVSGFFLLLLAQISQVITRILAVCTFTSEIQVNRSDSRSPGLRKLVPGFDHRLSYRASLRGRRKPEQPPACSESNARRYAITCAPRSAHN
jgi:hypothetical protein